MDVIYLRFLQQGISGWYPLDPQKPVPVPKGEVSEVSAGAGQLKMNQA
jgi:hypothetical protein